MSTIWVVMIERGTYEWNGEESVWQSDKEPGVCFVSREDAERYCTGRDDVELREVNLYQPGEPVE